MQAARPPLLRGVFLLAALAAIAFIMARGDNPAQATSYNPTNVVSVSDPTPGAAADIAIDFSLNAPDAFPNIKTNSSIQFIPRSWGIHVPETPEEEFARVGGLAGTFIALSTLGIFGTNACNYPVPVPFTMMDASVDTSNVTSALDLGAGMGPGGSDTHPGGLGYSGQFADDPETLEPPPDLGLPLINFNPDEKHNEYGFPRGTFNPSYASFEAAYRDVDNDGYISVGDIRLTPLIGGSEPGVVQEGDDDVSDHPGQWYAPIPLYPFNANEKHTDPDGNGQMDAGELIYRDTDGSGDVSYGDVREFVFRRFPPGDPVTPLMLQGGVSRYPDFLNQMFPPGIVGEPLARQWGGQNVLNITAASLNIVTFRPGQLPGYPATLGYPNVVVVLNPVAPIDAPSINMTSDLCTPLSLTSTNFGVSQDNPETAKDEGGYVRLTNPRAEKSHEFTLITTSQPDADDDGIENMLDTCSLTPNTDQDERGGGSGQWGGGEDGDNLDAACDPDPLSGLSSDEDQDGYANRADNCSVNPNGIEVLGGSWVRFASFSFYVAQYGNLIGSSDQLDTDGDDIGDACEGAESGGQCLNDIDDDADGAVNDGCPVNVAGAETGAQCDNAVDDDGDGYVNDGCPVVVGSPESGAQCSNATDDDGDGVVNEGCPTVSNAESGDQCLNDLDDDGDGKVNDGCPRVGTRSESSTSQTIREFLHPDSIIASSQYSATYSKEKAFDGKAFTAWCTSTSDRAPGNYIEAQFASPQDIRTVDLTNPFGFERFKTGTITMSNGFSLDVTLNSSGGGSFDISDQTGITWVRFTGLTQNTSDACFGEFNLNLNILTVPAECDNATDDDGDGVVNDGCPTFPSPNPETGAQCGNATDDDGDGYVNDGCPYGQGDDGNCFDALDNDGDGKVNDGCPAVVARGAPETACDNAVDDDADGLVNDGCESVDPGNVAKTTITGHMHVQTLTQGVAIFKHGVKLNQLGGPKNVNSGARTYSVDVSNLGSSAEDVQVGLRVVEGCAAVSGPSSVSVPADGSATASFTVDFTGCAAGTYTVQADACHAGDAAPAGLFGSGACPGTSDGMTDPNPLDDAPIAKSVEVGSP